MKLLIALLFIILLTLPSCHKNVYQTEINSISSPNDITVMTFNIRHADFRAGWTKNYRKEEIISILSTYYSDIICVQEAYNFQYEDIKSALPEYNSYGAGRTDGKEKGEFCPIFFKKERFSLIDSGTFWFSKTPEIAGSKVFIDIVPRICTWIQLKDSNMNKEVFVYNLHLTPISPSSRKKNIYLLKDRLKYPCIIAGDFNMGIDSRAMLPLDEMYNTYLKSNQIDHILCSRELTMKEFYLDVCQNYPSDHYALIAVLKWTTEE